MKVPEEGKVVLKFHAKWCGPCKTLKPVIDELKKENSDVIFLDVDIDEEEDLVREFRIKSVPHIHFLREGWAASSLVGMQTKEIIQQHIDMLAE